MWKITIVYICVMEFIYVKEKRVVVAVVVAVVVVVSIVVGLFLEGKFK